MYTIEMEMFWTRDITGSSFEIEIRDLFFVVPYRYGYYN
jgi:hypothetical protein